MYCKYYDFTEQPFTVTPNPRFVFLSKHHQEAFAHLIYGIDGHAGFIELTGEIGTGKTTVLRSLLCQLDDKKYTTALIFNPCLSATELLRSINREYGIAADGLSDAALLQELNRFLLTEKSAGRTVVLVIDEAQNLEPSVLERIRLISNLETDTDKLIQIVLSGQPELARLLQKQELRQLSQRITVRYHLRPMDFADTQAYIRHRLAMAASGLMPNFTQAAQRRIFRYSKGTPRLINILCDRILLIGYAEGRRDISLGMVRSAINEIAGEQRRHRSGVLTRWGVGGLVAAIVFGFSFYAIENGAVPRLNSLTGAGGEVAAVAASSELSAVKEALARIPQKESLLSAFNALAALCKVPPTTVYNGSNFAAIKDTARQVGLRTIKINGMQMLLQMDSPALLKIVLPGGVGVRYIAVTGIKGKRFLIHSPLRKPMSLSNADLRSLWSGSAYVFWKDSHEFPVLPVDNAKLPEIEHLQRILKNKNLYHGYPTGIYDTATINAVKAFQQENSLHPDGSVGERTLFYLYRDRADFPRLAHGKGEEKG